MTQTQGFRTGGWMAMLVIGVGIVTAAASQQKSSSSATVETLMGAALHQEEVEGNLDAAIATYKRVIADPRASRALTATALLHLGRAYETLGDPEARTTYDRVVREFADQTESVATARTRLAAIMRSGDVASSSKVVREVWPDAAEGPAAISPDGRHLVYGVWNALYIRDLLTSSSRRLTLAGSAEEGGRIMAAPVFSPDGKAVAYGSNEGSRTDLRLITLDGSARRLPYLHEEWIRLAPFEWSPDAKQILALAERRSGTRHIVLLSVADGLIHSLKTVAADYMPSRMSVSSDGRYIVYDYPAPAESAERDLFIMRIDGNEQLRLLRRATDDHHPYFTPDGNGVFFLSHRGGTTGAISAWFLRVLEGKPQGVPELLNPDMGNDVRPNANLPIGFTRSGAFYYRQRSNATDLYTAPFESTSGTTIGQLVPVTQRLVTQRGGGWSPNGQHLAYSSSRPSAHGEIGVIVIRSVQTGEEHELAPSLGPFVIRGWSPDSRSILLNVGSRYRGGGFYRVDAQSGEVALLLPSPPGVSNGTPNWSIDGRSIVFIQIDSEGERIVSRELEIGREIELYRSPGSHRISGVLEISTDGRLAFVLGDSKARTSAVMVITSTGAPARQLGTPVMYPEALDDIMGFTPDGRHVLFNTENLERLESGHRYWRIGVDGGIRQELQLPIEGYSDRWSFHPDGQRMAFSVESRKTAVWVMDHFLPKTGAAVIRKPTDRKTK